MCTDILHRYKVKYIKKTKVTHLIFSISHLHTKKSKNKNSFAQYRGHLN